MSLPMAVQILGVNEDGHQQADYNAAGKICDGRDLPFLESGPSDSAWTDWRVTYRDVVVLNADNEVVAVFNLTSHDLADAANHAALRDILTGAAGG
ncbi:MAG: hypothetical protein KC731_13995 [Myxococcales bacterium]|nr:hypothetical protein [Myxococcales bacterium]